MTRPIENENGLSDNATARVIGRIEAAFRARIGGDLPVRVQKVRKFCELLHQVLASASEQNVGDSAKGALCEEVTNFCLNAYADYTGGRGSLVPVLAVPLLILIVYAGTPQLLGLGWGE